MSIHETTEYIEIPVKAIFEYTPEEPPDYSELSPCDGSPEDVEPVNIIIPNLPTNPKEVWDLFVKNNPRWKETALEKIKADIEMIAEAHAAQKELQEKYERIV